MVLGWGRRPSAALVPSSNKVIRSRPLVSHELADLHSDDDDAPIASRLAPAAFAMRSTKMDVRLKNRTIACVDMTTEVDAPHDLLFDLLADPTQHERIFDSIESATSELVESNGAIKRWRLDYKARWKFWKVNGVCENKLWMTTNRDKGTVCFELREPGFLKTYEGMWTITGPHGGGPGLMNGRPSSCGSSISSASSCSSSCMHSISSQAPPAAPSSMWGRGLAGFLASITNPFAGLDEQIKGMNGGNSMAVSTASSPPETPSRAASFSVVGRSPTKIHITKSMCPKLTPPYPLSLTLKSQAVGQVNDMLNGLLAATGEALETERKADERWKWAHNIGKGSHK